MGILARDHSWPKGPHADVSETEATIARKTFATADASGAVGRMFHFAVIRLDDPTQRVIGTVGINSLVPAPAVGYGIHPEFWGKGYATEMVAAVIDAWWKLERNEDVLALRKEKLFAVCNTENIGSARVLQKVGFSIYDELFTGGDNVSLFELEMPNR